MEHPLPIDVLDRVKARSAVWTFGATVELAGGKRPAVVVTIGAYTYRSTFGSVGGRAMIPLSAENRVAAGVAAHDEVEVQIVLGAARGRRARRPGRGAGPARARLLRRPTASQRAECGRAGSRRPENAETRAARVSRAVERLGAGEKTR